jgi:hypothetical protein
MRKHHLLFFVVTASIVSAAELLSVVLTVQPATATRVELWTFFISLFAALSTSVGLLLYAIRRYRQKRSLHTALTSCLRQAALGSLVVVLILFFNTLGVLQVWDIVPLIAAAFLIEFFFQAEKVPRASLHYDS